MLFVFLFFFFWPDGRARVPVAAWVTSTSVVACTTVLVLVSNEIVVLVLHRLHESVAVHLWIFFVERFLYLCINALLDHITIESAKECHICSGGPGSDQDASGYTDSGLGRNTPTRIRGLTPPSHAGGPPSLPYMGRRRRNFGGDYDDGASDVSSIASCDYNGRFNSWSLLLRSHYLTFTKD